MVVSARVLVAILALAAARAHINSHDNILRIQLWDAEGLSKEPITTEPPTTVKPVVSNVRKSKVNLDRLYQDMIYEGFGGNEFGRFTRHKVRHKRRRPRQSGTELPWRFHEGEKSLNVAVFDEGVPWAVIEGMTGGSSAVSDNGEPSVKDVPAPMTLRQDEDEDEEVKKQLPVVPKCCPSGQSINVSLVTGKRVCSPSMLTFQPIFYQANDTHMWSYDSNVFETIVASSYDRYKLDPAANSEDEFYLLVNGTLFTPYHEPPFFGIKDYCMETFYNESNPAGVTLPLVRYQMPPVEEANTSSTLIAYAVGLIISVPFLLATAFVYTFITELRDTHGKALACHSTCLAVAFTCLAATQLASHAFSSTACTVMAYLIQFSFVSCFFWLNVMCFDTLLNVRRYINNSITRRSMRRRFAWYCAYAVLLPLVLLIVTITMELSPAVPSTYLKPNFGVKGCWFKTDQAALPYFYGPVAAILLCNLVIFLLTSRAFAMHYDKLKDVTALELTHSEYSASDVWLRFGDAIGETLTRSASPPRESSTDRLKKYRKIIRMETDPWLKLERAIGVPVPVKSKPGQRKKSPPSENTKLPQEPTPSTFQESTIITIEENTKKTPPQILVRPSMDLMKKYRKLFRTCCMLSIIMGLSWVMEVVSWAAGAGSDAVSVWSVFDVINALQGVVIFVIFVMQQPVRSIVKRISLAIQRGNVASIEGTLPRDSDLDNVFYLGIEDMPSMQNTQRFGSCCSE